MHPKSDSNAIWSEDGSKIVFSSNRNNGDHDIWFVWLQKKDWEKTKQDWDETSEEKKDKKGNTIYDEFYYRAINNTMYFSSNSYGVDKTYVLQYKAYLQQQKNKQLLQDFEQYLKQINSIKHQCLVFR